MTELYITHVETNMIHSWVYQRGVNRSHQYDLIIPEGHKVVEMQEKKYRTKAQEMSPEILVAKLFRTTMPQVLILDHISLSPTGEEETSQLAQYLKAVQDSDYQGKVLVTYFHVNETAMKNNLAAEQVDLEKVLFLAKPHSITELVDLVEGE